MRPGRSILARIHPGILIIAALIAVAAVLLITGLATWDLRVGR